MTRITVGIALTAVAGLVTVIVTLSGRDDWWGGPAIAGMLVVLYWSLSSVLLGEDSAG